MKRNNKLPFSSLEPFDEDRKLNVVIETPKGRRTKYKYDEELGIFVLDKVLPSGFYFPHDFGFVPSTLGGDGDPLDVLLFIDEPCDVGCLVKARLIGVIEAEQSDGKENKKNDRLLAVFHKSETYRSVKSINDLDETVLNQIEHFFISYHKFNHVDFRPTARRDSKKARAIIQKGREAFNKNRSSKSKKT